MEQPCIPTMQCFIEAKNVQFRSIGNPCVCIVLKNSKIITAFGQLILLISLRLILRVCMLFALRIGPILNVVLHM